MKTLKKIFFVLLSAALLSGGFYFFWASPRHVVPILMYHRFGTKESSLFVTPENFERQMNFLKNKGYRVIPLDKLAESIKNNEPLSRKTAVITIDDGYRDNYTYAYPILKKYGFPATIFLVAGFIDEDEDFLTWEQINAMSENNISFGGHTKNEKYLPLIKDEDELWEEIAGCKKIIEKHTLKPADYFCYPTGGFTQDIKDMVKKAGYKAACTTNRGFAECNKDLYELKRIKVKNSDTNKPFAFRAKLSGFYNLFRSRKAGH